MGQDFSPRDRRCCRTSSQVAVTGTQNGELKWDWQVCGFPLALVKWESTPRRRESERKRRTHTKNKETHRHRDTHSHTSFAGRHVLEPVFASFAAANAARQSFTFESHARNVLRNGFSLLLSERHGPSCGDNSGLGHIYPRGASS